MLLWGEAAGQHILTPGHGDEVGVSLQAEQSWQEHPEEGQLPSLPLGGLGMGCKVEFYILFLCFAGILLC